MLLDKLGWLNISGKIFDEHLETSIDIKEERRGFFTQTKITYRTVLFQRCW